MWPTTHPSGSAAGRVSRGRSALRTALLRLVQLVTFMSHVVSTRLSVSLYLPRLPGLPSLPVLRQIEFVLFSYIFCWTLTQSRWRNTIISGRIELPFCPNKTHRIWSQQYTQTKKKERIVFSIRIKISTKDALNNQLNWGRSALFRLRILRFFFFQFCFLLLSIDIQKQKCIK